MTITSGPDEVDLLGDDPQPSEPPAASGVRRWIPWPRYRFGGMIGALVFLWLSMTPSLLPRSALFQGIVAGAAAALGYAVGVAVVGAVRWVLHRETVHPPARWLWWLLALVGVAGTVWMFVDYSRWQDELRTLMGSPSLSPAGYPLTALVAVVLFVLLVALVRAFLRVVRWVGRQVGRVAPPRVSAMIGGVVVIGLVVAILNGVVARVGMAALNDAFEAANQEHVADTPAPTVAERSGGPDSLVTWDSLGREGRVFVGGGPTVPELTAFARTPAREPIRAYIGLGSGGSPEAEAALAVRELERTGAFDRAVLAVATPTGSGWLNPSTADGLEYTYGGDTAIVSMQYSYLPSPLSFLVDQARAQHAGQALFDAVYTKWETLPADHRPKLVAFGESLGTFGGEAAFGGAADMAARTDGVLFVGPPYSNVVWQQLTARRDPGSPERLPIYRRGQTVRFISQPSDLNRPELPWPGSRVVYLQHASDPITWWSPSLLFDRPDWLAEPRGSDVLPSTHWFPIVTFLQLSADMAVSNGVPDGHGHTFHADIANAWAAILHPPGWTPADTQRLREILVSRSHEG